MKAKKDLEPLVTTENEATDVIGLPPEPYFDPDACEKGELGKLLADLKAFSLDPRNQERVHPLADDWRIFCEAKRQFVEQMQAVEDRDVGIGQSDVYNQVLDIMATWEDKLGQWGKQDHQYFDEYCLPMLQQGKTLGLWLQEWLKYEKTREKKKRAGSEPPRENGRVVAVTKYLRALFASARRLCKENRDMSALILSEYEKLGKLYSSFGDE